MTDQEQAILLINRLEALSRSRPAAYRFRVALVAALGYAYLLLVVVVLLIIVIATVFAMFMAHHVNFLTLKLVWIPLVLAGLVMRSIWVAIPAPDGKELQREQAGPLFDLIAEVQNALNGPEVHHVLLSDDFNAGIVQVPRFGMFGWISNYVVIGLPLMKALDAAEFRAVLAHEFGHLSGKHGRFAGWIYRLRQSWIQILTIIDQERRYASFIFEWFLKWYAPYFNAYSFVLARAQEYEADSYAVEIAGTAVAARTLAQLEVKGRALQEEIWSDFYRQANDQAQPPKDPFVLILRALEQPIAHAKAEKWFLQSLKVKTGYDDTHPALAERLAAMGFDRNSVASDAVVETLVRTNASAEETAAERYLKLIPEEVTDSFNRLWREQIAQPWQQKHNYIQQARQRLTELNNKGETQPLTIDEQWERARCLGETGEPAAALPVVKDILEQKPDHTGANFALGAILIEQRDLAGIEYLEKAMQLNPATTGDACELIYESYREQGKQREAEAYHIRAEQYYEAVQQQHEHAMNISAQDHFEAHDLEGAELQDLQAQLANIRGLATVYLVRKIVDGAILPLYVFAVSANYTWRNGRSEKDIPGLLSELASELQFASPSVFVALETNPQLMNPVTQIRDARIYPK